MTKERESWIRFDDSGSSNSGKTNIWAARSKNGNHDLGKISWYAPWRCYTFTPYNGTVFEKDCLRLIADFCQQRTEEHKP